MSVGPAMMPSGTGMNMLNPISQRWEEQVRNIEAGVAAYAEERKLVIVLETDDYVGHSFWLAASLQLAATIFFFFQVFLVPRRWANSMIVAGLVTGIAWHHYTYMKDLWAETKSAPTVYRYMDWLITVPLQVVEFYLILLAASPEEDEGTDKEEKQLKLGSNLFFRLLSASLLMLVFGYMGETEVSDKWVAFASGCFCWFYIVYEVYLGEASRLNARLSLGRAKKFLKQRDQEKDAVTMGSKPEMDANAALREFKKPEAQLAFEILRAIIFLGWALYPIGYVAGNMGGDNEVET
ncbi:unnamed protein product [Amoebophrya sp. A25]|nr:unnamed protein product [Amoebophrya sp. A25]|eukprot:GSA25T00025483001.1